MVVVVEPARFSDDEFERLLASPQLGDVRLELRDGVIVRLNAEYTPHSTAKRLVARLLENALSEAAPDWIVDTETSIRFGSGFAPLPDVLVWAPGVLDRPPRGSMPSVAVRLCVEIADTTLADDLGPKLRDYARAGLEEYWVVDLKGHLILQHAGPGEDGYATRTAHAFGAVFPLMILPRAQADTATLKANALGLW